MKRAADISNSQLHSGTETITNDLSVLRKPIKTSITGLYEARKAYDNGTEEVRKLLSNECDIIYECKVCRNMFRSLANFISHKRIYCKNAYTSTQHSNFRNDGNGYNQDISTIVQAENDFIGSVRNGKNNDKDLSSIIDRLVKREKASRMMNLSDFYEQVNNKLTQDEFLQKRYVLQLDVVPESNVAVYQTVKSSQGDDDASSSGSCGNGGDASGISGDTIKNEVMEVQSIMDEGRTVLGPDGKIVDAIDLPKFGDEDDKQLQPFECEICNSKFATEKTLKLHIEMKHIPSTYVFQCPSCSKTYLQVGQVIRHLTNDHKKSMRRVRLMRDSILKRRTRIDEVPVKGPNRELARLQTDKDLIDSQNKAWLDNLENGDTNANICLFCGRRFERKAVLLSHHKVCQQKKKPNNRISLTRKVDYGKSGANTNSNASTATNSNLSANANGWTDRDYDDSSNSNSLDASYLDETTATIKTERNIKTEKSIKIETTESDNTLTTNKRKRNRAVRAVNNVDANLSDDDKSLNICLGGEPAVRKIKEERVSPTNVPNSNHTVNNIDAETIAEDANANAAAMNQLNRNVVNEASAVKNEKKTRTTTTIASTTSGTASTNVSKTKPKLTSSHCKYCFKKFSNASNLRRHITMTHSGLKKFTCNLCKVDQFRARRKIDIISHMRTKHQFNGERGDAFKFITVNDAPSPKPTPSINRRKERHTEVLRDDEEEIFIETEPFVQEEEPIENLSSMETSNESSNIEVDEDLTATANDAIDESNDSSKRKGRSKTNTKCKKPERSLSSSDKKEETETLPTRNRPVRNRIMPVKKDFVYDLSTLLKKDYKDFQHEFQRTSASAQLTQQVQQPHSTAQNKSRTTSPTPQSERRSSSRRNTLPDVEEAAATVVVTVDNEPSQTERTVKKPSHPHPAVTAPEAVTMQSNDENDKVPQNQINATDPNNIRGAAIEMAQRAVQANRAVFFKAPNLPIDRSLSASIITPQRQLEATAMKDWPVLKRPPAIYDELKKKLSNIKVPGLKRKKRSCLLKHVTNNKSHHKNRLRDCKANTNGHTDKHSTCNNDLESINTDSSIKISSKLADKIQMQCAAQIECNNVNLDTTIGINAIEKIDSSSAARSLSITTPTPVPSPTATATATVTAPVTTPRRMTLLERLRENKTKKLNESLSRMTIGSSDHDEFSD